MAGGKETPRQKMIGMMYLVLTALLALNVSKEIINAFVKLDQKLMDGNQVLLNQSDQIMMEFENAMILKENKPIVKPFYDQALEIKKRVYEIDKFIQIDCKNELIKTVEGKDWIKADDENKRFITLNPMEIQTKDDYDAATRLFGGEPGTEGYLKGEQIRKKIHAYRDNLIKYITTYEIDGKKYGFHPEKINDTDSLSIIKSFEEELKQNVYTNDHENVKAIFNLLTLPKLLKEHDEEVEWHVGMFDHAPVVAASALFTSLSNDIRQSEIKALEIIRSRFKVDIIKVNKIEPMAFANSGYINFGDSLNVRVKIAAYDSTEINPIRYKYEGDENWIEDNGDIKLMGNKNGKHKIIGQIGVKERGVLKWKDWVFNYEVGKPTAVISNADLNILYSGIDNKIEATASGYSPEDISVTGFSGMRKNGEYYLLNPPRSMANQIITINVSAKDKNGKSKSLGQKQFKVKRLPLPNTFLGSASNLKAYVTLPEILATKKVSAAYDGSVAFTMNWKVNGFKMSLSKDGIPYTLTSNDDKLTSQMESYLRSLPRGSNISITDIRISSTAGNEVGPNLSLILR